MDFVLPELFEEKMKKLLGEEWSAFWESYASDRFQALRMNQLKLDVSPDKEKQVREKFCLEKQVPWAKNAYYYESDVRPGKHPYHEIGVYYIEDAHKPSTKGYEAAMRKMGTEKSTTIFVGDQLFTDVFGARRTGIYSILVKPIHPKEEIQIVLKRRLEAIVLHFYKKQQGK